MAMKYKGKNDPDSVDLDVLTVYPSSVRSASNPGMLSFSVSAKSHATAVVNKLGWDSETRGHWVHEF